MVHMTNCVIQAAGMSTLSNTWCERSCAARLQHTSVISHSLSNGQCSKNLQCRRASMQPRPRTRRPPTSSPCRARCAHRPAPTCATPRGHVYAQCCGRYAREQESKRQFSDVMRNDMSVTPWLNASLCSIATLKKCCVRCWRHVAL
jgi:hypothetical protein